MSVVCSVSCATPDLNCGMPTFAISRGKRQIDSVLKHSQLGRDRNLGFSRIAGFAHIASKTELVVFTIQSCRDHPTLSKILPSPTETLFDGIRFGYDLRLCLSRRATRLMSARPPKSALLVIFPRFICFAACFVSSRELSMMNANDFSEMQENVHWRAQLGDDRS